MSNEAKIKWRKNNAGYFKAYAAKIPNLLATFRKRLSLGWPLEKIMMPLPRLKVLRRVCASVLLSLVAVGVAGCGTRFILETPGTVGVLIKPIGNAEVLLPDKDGVPTPGKVNLPEGTLIQYPKPAKSAEGVTK